MTDPVEALADALLTVPDEDGKTSHRDTAAEYAADILAALRASGFDVVPTGEPAGSADAARESLTQRLVALDVADPHRIVAEFEAAIRAESTGTLNVAEAYDAGHSDGMQTHDDVGYCQHDGQKYARLSSSDTGGRVEPMTEQEMDDAIKDRRLPW